MNMFARFDEITPMILQDIKETNVTDARTDRRTHGQLENNIPSTNKVWEGSITKNNQQQNHRQLKPLGKLKLTLF